MRLHLLEHDPFDFSNTNISIWAGKKGYHIAHTYLCNNQTLPAINDFDWLIVMGGSPHAWEEEVYLWLPAEKKFIAEVLDHNKIILGICFGAQLLAETLGGEVFVNPQREIGWYDVTLTAEGRRSYLFQNVPQQFTTFHWHADHFKLPPGCTRLAYSEATENQAYISREQPVAGIQFHPEYPLAMVQHFAREYGDEWQTGPYVAGKEKVLAQTEHIPETYGLMATILDNMDRQFKENN
ncbi:MAG: type 1 glutamine amidotransferase [Deltaproteobacteria bacterium]|jgi:GMP synthase (glutamine-hydrolysing)|nr:type 1 glutamine amidotransferase [Deltaproteobacteria bacterium]